MSSTFKEYLQSQDKSKSTITHYSTYIYDFLNWLDRDGTDIDVATSKEVMAYLSYLQRKGLENKTRNIRLNVIRQFFNWQIQQELRTSNPAAHIKIRGAKQRKLYSILSIQELDHIYSSYEVPEDDDPRSNRNWFQAYKLGHSRNKAVLSLMVNQGLTTPEIEQITVDDLKLQEGKLYVRGSRNSNERLLELKSNQIMVLMEYLFTTRKALEKQQASETKQLFLSLPIAGQPHAAPSLQIWKGLTRELKKAHPHFINFRQVRTSVITHWLKHNNLRQVQYMAGHRYVSSTEAYLVNHTEDLQADIDQFHPLG